MAEKNIAYVGLHDLKIVEWIFFIEFYPLAYIFLNLKSWKICDFKCNEVCLIYQEGKFRNLK